MFVLILLLSITALAALAQGVSFARMMRHVKRELARRPTDYLPRLSVILPCKGLDPGFRDNMARLLSQDYADPQGKPFFEVIFAVASKEDPAYQSLKDLLDEQNKIPAKLVVAGFDSGRGQKINNQLQALKAVSDDSEVFVFVDSDVIARSDFLKRLVEMLDQPGVGATTGYRFYIPIKGELPALLRSLWNRMSAWELANPYFAFAWGGGMAIKRSTFDKAKVHEHWEKAVDDDLSLTKAVKNIGLRVHFVPQCLVASHGDDGWREVIEWTNRQLILTKVYYPELWLLAILRASILAVWLVTMLWAIFACLRDPFTTLNWWAVAAGLSLPAVELTFLLKSQSLWHSVLFAGGAGIYEEAYEKSFWRFVRVIPVAHLVLPWMTLYSIATNRIRWRGVDYLLKSASETVIL